MVFPEGVVTSSVVGPGGSGMDASGNLVAALGTGLRVVAGANAKSGTALLAAGTKVVATTQVGANSLIFLCHKGDGGNIGILSETKAGRVNGTSFTILSSNGADVGHVDWLIVESV
jgi:hypothetical protein